MKKMLLFIVVIMLFVCSFEIQASAKNGDRETEVKEEIPTIKIDPTEDPISLGVPSSGDWGEGEEPLFDYSIYPGAWYNKIEAYQLDGERQVWKVENFYMEVTPKGAFGPVWKITNHSGALVGVTDHYFLFEDNGTVYAVESGTHWNGVQHKFSELPSEEKKTRREVKEGSVRFVHTFQIDSWKSDFVSWMFEEENHTSVEVTINLPEMSTMDTIFLADKTWYKIGNSLFFVQSISPRADEKEIVFIGGYDGIEQVIIIPFEGEFKELDSEKITFERGGRVYCKPLVPIYVNGTKNYPELPAEVFADGVQLKGAMNVESWEVSELSTDKPF